MFSSQLETNHAHRLAANILQYSRSSQFDAAQLDIDLHVFKVRSSYVKEWTASHQSALQYTASLDSAEIKEIYQSLPWPEIECRAENGSYNLPEIESLIHDYIQQNNQEYTKPSAPARSIFSPLSSHDQLVEAVKAYIKTSPVQINPSFLITITDKQNYSLALRNACSWGNTHLVELLINFSDQLHIDFNQTSSNGKTPMAWFEESHASLEDKIKIRAILAEKMQPSQEPTSKP